MLPNILYDLLIMSVIWSLKYIIVSKYTTNLQYHLNSVVQCLTRHSSDTTGNCNRVLYMPFVCYNFTFVNVKL